MSDAKLRKNKRQAVEGDLERQVQVLRERLRSGELDPARLTLAAELGDPRALALEEAPLAKWSVATHRKKAIRSAIKLGGLSRLAWVASEWTDHAWGHDPRVAEAILAARANIECPCEEHYTTARRLARKAVVELDREGTRALDLGGLLIVGTARSASSATPLAASCAAAAAEFVSVGNLDWQERRAAEYEWQRLCLANSLLNEESPSAGWPKGS